MNRWAWPGAAGLAVGGVIAAVLPTALVGVFYDDGIYLALAQSLAEGHGYRLLYLPGAPAAVHYPFLYPALLALLWKVGPAFPANVTLMRDANAALMGVFAALTVAQVRGRVAGRRWAGALVIALAATAIPLVAVATALFAEPLFMALAAGACLVADAARRAPGPRGLLLAAGAGALAGAAALTRSIGVAVAGGIVLALLAARRPRGALTAGLVAVALLAPWSLWVAAHGSEVDAATVANYGTYFDLLRQSGWSWLSPASLVEVAAPLGVVALPPPVPLRLALAVPALAILAAGIATLVREIAPIGWSLVCYLAIVLLWPYGPDRFLWAALPWLAVAFALGVQATLRRAGEPTGRARLALRALALGLAAVVAARFVALQVRGYAHGSATSTQRGISATMAAVLPWIRQVTDTAAVLAGEDEALLWLYTGRRAVPSYLWRVRGRSAESLGPDSLRAFFTRWHVTHVILTGPGSDAAPTIDALLARYPGYLRVVRAWPGPMLAFRVEGG